MAFVAQDRVEGPEGWRIGGTDAAEGVEDDGAKGRVADVAGQQRIAARQGAARGKAVEDARDMPGIEDLALPVGVAGVVGELHAVHRPDLDEIGRAACRERVCQYV